MVLGSIFVASITVIIRAILYAYFTADIGKVKNQEFVMKAGTMQLRFADKDEQKTNYCYRCKNYALVFFCTLGLFLHRLY